jgi:hypothetical protein
VDGELIMLHYELCSCTEYEAERRLFNIHASAFNAHCCPVHQLRCSCLCCDDLFCAFCCFSPSTTAANFVVLLTPGCFAAAGQVEAFTETTEFVRSIQVTGPKAAEDGSSYMDVDEPAAAAAAATPLPPPPSETKPPAAKQRKYRKGGWVAADGQEDEEQQVSC